MNVGSGLAYWGYWRGGWRRTRGLGAGCANRRKVLAVQIFRMTQGVRSEMIGSSLNGRRNSGQERSLYIMKL